MKTSLRHWEGNIFKIMDKNFGSDEIIEATAHDDDNHQSLARLRLLVCSGYHDGRVRVI